MKPITSQISLKNSFMYSIMGNTVFAFSQWVIIVIIAKVNSPEVLGQYSLGLAITIPIFLFLGMNFRSIQAADYVQLYEFNDYFYTRVLTSAIGLVVTAFIVLLSDFIFDTKLIILAMALYRFFESISDVSHGLFQQKERMDILSYSKILQSLLSVILFTISLIVFGSILISILFQSISFLAIFLFYNLKWVVHLNNRKKILTKGKNVLIILKNNSKQLIVLGLPLGFVAGLDSLNSNLPRFMIQYFMDERNVGFYSSIMNIMIAFGTVISALCHAAIPRLAKYYVNKDAVTFYKLLKNLMLFGFVVSSFSILASYFYGDTILSILYTNDYSDLKYTLTFMMIAGLFWYTTSFISTALIAVKKYTVQVPIMITSTIITFIFSLIFIPLYGIDGAVYSVILSNIIRLFISIVIFRYKV
ncbi:O-antigen/teichoic acid export membrane protein [Bacillus mesophilus]|uniref:Oligosaccharide flippase family protein n=1 Tax=Bacillus mesophilus TaxID=1808955 RepID=A0A6M0Q7Z0_9BACI|nr:oligosaccharide flippase family protein [Bacillus mesophilus]MBM7661723.1 O-antigen/teichoic acid export membrane protein [Bacillus mesophilus]NEY72383.1 oligosaccharide flippase family protein [Bacillus mesophilus]